MLNLIEQIKTECLFAFCHARINGVAGKDEMGERIFNSHDLDDYMIKSAETLSTELAKFGTIESVNNKITKCLNTNIAIMYNARYNHLLNLLDSSIPLPDKVEDIEDTKQRGYKKGSFIEALIGLNLIALYLESDSREKSINISVKDITDIISKFETETNTSRRLINDMAKFSTIIFHKYCNVKNKIKRKKKWI